MKIRIYFKGQIAPQCIYKTVGTVMRFEGMAICVFFNDIWHVWRPFGPIGLTSCGNGGECFISGAPTYLYGGFKWIWSKNTPNHDYMELTSFRAGPWGGMLESKYSD